MNIMPLTKSTKGLSIKKKIESTKGNSYTIKKIEIKKFRESIRSRALLTERSGSNAVRFLDNWSSTSRGGNVLSILIIAIFSGSPGVSKQP